MSAISRAVALLEGGNLIPIESVQDEATKSIVKLYNTELRKKVQAIKTQYAGYLQSEVEKLRNAGDFGGAIAMKRERTAVEEEIASGVIKPLGSAVPPPAPEKIVLTAADASALGEVELAQRWDALIRWFGPGSGAAWAISPVPKGNYIVEINYSSVEIGDITIQQGDNSVDFSVPSTGSWDNYKSEEVGKITISDQALPLQILVKQDHSAPFGILNLRSVTLIPSLEENPLP